MPELPDVETFRRYLNRTAKNKRIDNVVVATTSLVKDTSKASLKRQLKGHRITKTKRHGKYLLGRLSSDTWLVLHFGMTGDLQYYKSEEDEPDYTALRLDLANNYHLAYTSRRKLGEVRIVSSPDELAEEKELGPDVYSKQFSKRMFIDTVRRSRGVIKTTLMNQSMMSGLGNVYADEVLFQVGVHPSTPVKKLDDGDLGKIYNTIRRVLRTTITHKADPDDFPRTYFTGKRESNRACPRCSGTIRKAQISGRPTYYCSRHQKKNK